MANIAAPVRYAGQVYLLEFGLAIALYSGAVVLRHFAPALHLTGTLATVANYLPVVPVWLMFAAVWRHYLRIDEFDRKRLLETLAVAFGFGSCLITSYSLLTDVGLPPLAITWAWPTLAASWGLTAAIRALADR
jgi:hypothetical protein